MQVDEDTRPGQYLLTGSTNLNAVPSIRESLAGRVAKVRLRPFSQGEIAGTNPTFLETLFSGMDTGACFPDTDRDGLLELGFRGGYPEALSLPERRRARWYADYINALLERDLSDISRIHRMDAMRTLVEVLAAWSSKCMDIAGITAKLSIKRATVETYINALEALYLVERIHPWTKTDNQLLVHVDGTEDYRLYHYRDWEQREVDFLIERVTDGALAGIEIKAGASVGQRDFKHLAWFKDNLAKDRPFTGVILYAGKRTLGFGKNLQAVPFTSLWR